MKKKIFFTAMLSVFSFAFCTPAFAALFEFDPQEKTVGLDQEFDVALMLTADRPVNAVKISLAIPRGLEPVETSDGNSIVNFWIEKPSYDALNRKLEFSGIIPGGFTGRQGRLIVVTFKASTEGALSLGIDKAASKVLLNDSLGTEEPFEAASLTLRALRGRDNLRNEIPDDEPPEPFVPFLVQENELNGGAWTLVFATQDKESGVARYEVQESAKPRPSGLRWKEAESPYLVADQGLHSYIFVKAVDDRGNERIARLEPRNGEGRSHAAAYAAAFIACAAALAFLMRRRLRYILKRK